MCPVRKTITFHVNSPLTEQEFADLMGDLQKWRDGISLSTRWQPSIWMSSNLDSHEAEVTVQFLPQVISGHDVMAQVAKLMRGRLTKRGLRTYAVLVVGTLLATRQLPPRSPIVTLGPEAPVPHTAVACRPSGHCLSRRAMSGLVPFAKGARPDRHPRAQPSR